MEEARRPVSLRTALRFSVAIIIAVYLGLLAFFVIATPSWSAEEAFRTWTESQHDMVLDTEGNPKIACLGVNGSRYSLNFAEPVDGSWSVTPLKAINHDYSGISIALDSQDRAYICTGEYSYADDSLLTFATNRDGIWKVEDIMLGYRYLTSGIALDSQDRVHILCSVHEMVEWGSWSYVAHLLHLTEGVDGWERSDIYVPVENSTTLIKSFKIGPGDVMHALVSNTIYPYSIYDDQGVTYLNYSSTLTGTWAQETIPDFSIGGFHSHNSHKAMAIDKENRAHICAYAWNSATDSYLINYRNNVNGDWASSNLSYAGNAWPSWCSIALDSRGAIHIAYYAIHYTGSPYYSNCTERYVTNRDGSWHQEIVDDRTGWIGTQRISIAVGLGDRVHIAYFCNLGGEDTGDRYYVRYSTPTNRLDALGGAALWALPYALGTIPFVCVGLLILRRRNWRRIQTERQVQWEMRKHGGLSPPDE